MADHGELINAIKRRLMQQLEYYRELAALAADEKDALAKNDHVLLTKVVSRKQKYLDKLELLRRELAKLHAEWGTVREAIDAETKKEIKKLTDETEAVLQGLIDVEQGNMADVRVKKDDVSKKISALKYTTNAARSYMGTAAGSAYKPSVIDTKIK